MAARKALFLTNEYPPHIYGGAGVHVEYLTKALSKFMDVEVRCFGDQDVVHEHLKVKGYGVPAGLTDSTPKELKSPVGTLARCVGWNAVPIDADVVHCHTWYSHFGGILAKLIYGVPMVITTHSLEPLRPWKREQIGRGYDFSSWVEKTALEMADAIIAVSSETKNDILKFFRVEPDRIKVVPNGIDVDEYRPVSEHDELEKYKIPLGMPYVLFVGRITRQKGIIHLVRAIKYIDESAGIVLCAGAPDTPEIAKEMSDAVAEVQKTRKNLFWIQEMVSRKAAVQLYSHAKVFCCPSIYEPFGIINLEAMACGVPVVASAVGGIKEVVLDGETGFLVKFEQEEKPPFEALNPEKFAKDLAEKINLLLKDNDLRNKMGEAGLKRAREIYSWDSIARKVKEVYDTVTAS